MIKDNEEQDKINSDNDSEFDNMIDNEMKNIFDKLTSIWNRDKILNFFLDNDHYNNNYNSDINNEVKNKFDNNQNNIPNGYYYPNRLNRAQQYDNFNNNNMDNMNNKNRNSEMFFSDYDSHLLPNGNHMNQYFNGNIPINNFVNQNNQNPNNNFNTHPNFYSNRINLNNQSIFNRNSNMYPNMDHQNNVNPQNVFGFNPELNNQTNHFYQNPFYNNSSNFNKSRNQNNYQNYNLVPNNQSEFSPFNFNTNNKLFDNNPKGIFNNQKNKKTNINYTKKKKNLDNLKKNKFRNPKPFSEQQNIFQNKNDTQNEIIQKPNILENQNNNIKNIIPENESENNKNKTIVKHPFSCNICNVNPIIGKRYKSISRNDYDLCEKCWQSCNEKDDFKLIEFKNLNLKPNGFVLEINPNNKMTNSEAKFLENFFDSILNKNKKKDQENKINSNMFEIDNNKEIDELDIKLNNISDLIELGKLYENEDYKNKNYSVNIEGINKMKSALEELNNLVGLENIKKKIVDQIVFFSQNLHNKYEIPEIKETPKENPIFTILNFGPQKTTNEQFNKNESCLKNDDNLDMLHTVIEGPPGVGKTIFGKLLARIYLCLGITSKDTFKIVRRTDLVGEYLGHTAMKTQKAIDESLGGVLFIDEAYQLGNGNSKKIDSYSKECIDTLNQNLSEKKGQFICIIAGYEKELEENFFSMNPGLKRRFSFKYKMEGYNWEELTNILIYKINKMKWKINDETKKWLMEKEYLKDYIDQFPNFGGDIESFLLNIKIEHGLRVFGKDTKHHKIINIDDIIKGYERYKENKNIKKEIIPFQLYC